MQEGTRGGDTERGTGIHTVDLDVVRDRDTRRPSQREDRSHYHHHHPPQRCPVRVLDGRNEHSSVS